MSTSGGPQVQRVQLFGDARVADANGDVSLTPTQLSLVSLVYGHGADGLTRPEVAGLLWGPNGSGKWRNKIRTHLLDIRLRVGWPIIDAVGDSLRPAAAVGCDLSTFESALSGGSLQEAAALISRGFISTSFSLAEPYEDWREARGARLLRDVRTRAFARWTRGFDQGEWAEAHDAAEALYTLDPEDPKAVERVIDARARLGLLDAAESAFAEHMVALGPGVEPPSEVITAIERVRAIARVDSSVGEPNGSPAPFVGRRGALQTVRCALDRVERGQFEFVVLSGESGIGKTRVLDEIHREALLREFRCMRAQPVELERSIPLNPLLDALRDVEIERHLAELGSPWSEVIASLLPPGALDHPPEEPPPIQPKALSRRLLDSFALLFEGLAREQPTILFLDDLQWADATTVATLQFMQRRWKHGSMGVFATLRPEVLQPDDPLRNYVGGTAGLQVRQVELHALTTAEALQLVDAISEGAVSQGRAQQLCSIAGHHPLYLTELTRDLQAGRLTLPERPSDQVKIPSSLEQMLDVRLEAMDDHALRVAGVLAVAAKPLRVKDLAELTSLSLDEAAGGADALLRARFIEVERDYVRIAHELFRSAVYRHLSEPRRAVHHRAIAHHLLSISPVEFAGELAIHFAQAGEAQLAAEHGWAAAERALAAGAMAEAIQVFEVVAENDPDPSRQADATAELAKALHLSRDITGAIPQLRLAAERLRSTGRPRLARRLEIHRVEGLADTDAAPLTEILEELVGIKLEAHEAEDWESVALALDAELHLLHRSGNVDGILVLLGELRQVAESEAVEARLLARTGLALGIFFDDPDLALKAAKEAVALAADVKRYRLRALTRLMVVLQARGQLTLPAATEVVEEARALARSSGDVLLRFSIESNLAVAFLDAGDVERAEVLMARAREIAGKAEMDINRFNQANNEAELSLARDDYVGAAQAFSEAASYLGLTTPSYMRDVVNAGLGYCAMQMGDLAEARRRDLALQPQPRGWYFDPTTILTFRARVLERKGRYSEAIQLLSEAAATLERRLVLAWLKVVLLQVRLMAKHVPTEAKRLAERAGREAEDRQLTYRARELAELASRLS